MRHPPPSTRGSHIWEAHNRAPRDLGSRRTPSTWRFSTSLTTFPLPSFDYWKGSLRGRSKTMQHWFGELFVLNHTIPRSNWELHGFHKQFGALHSGTHSVQCPIKWKARTQRSSLPGSHCPLLGVLQNGLHGDAWGMGFSGSGAGSQPRPGLEACLHHLLHSPTAQNFLMYKSEAIIPIWQVWCDKKIIDAGHLAQSMRPVNGSYHYFSFKM